MISKEFSEALRDCAARIDGIPEERFYPKLRRIMDFKTEAHGLHCGTLACAAGWERLYHGDAIIYDESRLEALVALNGRWWGDLFGSRACSRYDASAPSGISDKDLFRWRVIQFLREHGEPVSEDYARGW